MTEIKKNETIEICNLCGEPFCTICNPKRTFMKWILCNDCFGPYREKREKRKERIKRIRKNRNLYGKFLIETFKTMELKHIIESISELYDDIVKIEIDNKGLILMGLTLDRICFIHLNLYPQFFNNLKPQIKKIKLFLELEDFNKIIERFSNTEPIKIYRNSGEEEISIKSKKLIKFKPSDDLHEEDFPFTNLVKIKYPIRFSIEITKLIEILEDLKEFSNTFEIKGTEKGITFNAESEVVFSYQYPLDKEELLTFEIEEKAKATYSVGKILPIVEKLQEITDSVKICIKKDTPLKVSFNFTNSGTLTHYIAPKVAPKVEEE